MAVPARDTTSGSGAGSGVPRRGRPKRRPRTRLIAPGADLGPEIPKGGRLPSLMHHMINRRAFSVVILLSTLLLAGCSGVFGESPGERADQAITEANGAIDEHNRLFEDARGTYADVKQQIESGNEPSAQQNRIMEARDKMEQARSRLQDARDSLGGVNDLDVDPAVKRYAGTLSDAMEAQISAEDREIEFYTLLEEDPALQNNREEAENLLEQVGNDYERAEQAYAEARDLADENPDLIEETR